MDEVFLLLDSFTVFRGSNGIQVVFRSSLQFGTPENRYYNDFFHFFKNELSPHNSTDGPTKFRGETRSTDA